MQSLIYCSVGRSAISDVAKIQDYGIIGDCRAAALISKYGSIDWLCWPRFDSPSIFAAILDRARGGFWAISPSEEFRVARSYVQHTNVLETRFVTSSGQAILTDLMPVASEEFKHKNLLPDHEVLRQICCREGEIRMDIDFHPRADYGSSSIQIKDLGKCGLRMDAGHGAYWLRSTVPLRVEQDRAHALLTLKAGDCVQFSLTYGEESPVVLPAVGEGTHSSIQRSIDWWRSWAARARYDGPYREDVVRSALALKLLAYAPSGAIIAAPTTSLPERVGDSLNWDYRYCWPRDASLTVRAMVGLGYVAEAESFLTWLLHATRLSQPELLVLYTVFGELAPEEKVLSHLRGHFDSRPVRVGNAARRQFQLDIYGEVIDAAAQYAQNIKKFDRTTQKALVGLGKYVAQNWNRADQGIWEPRSAGQNHTHSRLLCWVALDRLLALYDKGFFESMPKDWFTRERDRIRDQIESRAWNEKLQSYTESLDGDRLDASLLRIGWYGLESANSERMRRTYKTVREKLGAGNSLLYRSELQAGEGAFGICGFWAVEHLALGGGTLREAHEHFRELLQRANDLGLFSEEIDPRTGDALGNFPQAFTHVGLISAALTLKEKERDESHPAERIGKDVKPSTREARV